MKLLRPLALLLLLAVSTRIGADTPPPKPEIDERRVSKLLANAMPVLHLSHVPCDDGIAVAALNIFLDTLDYDHCYFLASDVALFRAEATRLDDSLKKGDSSFAFKVYDTFKQRVTNRVAYVNKLLDEGFDLTVPETYAWKRKTEPWPTNVAEWDDLWRRKVKNEYIARKVAQELAEAFKAGATNAAAEAGAEAVTNATAETEAVPGLEAVELAPAETQGTPEEQIRKQYTRYVTLLNDNDALWVLDRYLNAFTQAYDPHSDYMSPHEAEDFDISMKLSLVGIGALLSSEDGAAKVERLIAGGPAERDGRLKPGDKIIAVAQGDAPPTDILHLPLHKAVRMIRGEKGTKVVLSIIPASDTSGSTVTRIDLVRDEVKLEEQAAKGTMRSVKGSDGVVRSLGIVTLPEFYADLRGGSQSEEARSAARDVKRIVEDLVQQGAEGIILDLRNNGGGSLSEAVEMTGHFIDSGPVVQVKDQRRLHILSDPRRETVYDGPLVVLVNRMSASASEILAAALQDYGRAVIVGDSKTHGKGTVQTLTNLSNADPKLGSLKVTTASFYRIAGGSTQLNGVKPDIILPSALDEMELGEEFLPHALKWSEVYPAFYEPQVELKEIIPQLQTESLARRENDPRFDTYERVLAKVTERQKQKEISLRLDDRIDLARSERELQKELRENEATEGDKDLSKDIILGETLNILSDLVIQLDHSAANKKKLQAGTNS
jgi:carboxyl-terminal processing protease